jgi:hypothetical protein
MLKIANKKIRTPKFIDMGSGAPEMTTMTDHSKQGLRTYDRPRSGCLSLGGGLLVFRLSQCANPILAE